MDTVSVEPVRTKKDLMNFIKLPWEIYKDDKYWVPPLLMDRKKLLDTKHNPFYKHSEIEMFLARRDGKIVGRNAAIINYNHNKFQGEEIGFFGFFESFNDQQVANALFDAAKDWIKKKGYSAMRGPVNPSTNDELGLLVDGFDSSPLVLMTYNPRYYIDLYNNYGLKKEKDLFAFHVNKDRVFSDKLERVSRMIVQKEGVVFRSIDMKRLNEEIKKVKEVYNEAWSKNWGFVPMTDEEFDFLAADLKQVVEPQLAIFAEVKGKPVGFALSLPDINYALKFNKKGHLLPGVYHLLTKKKHIHWIRIMVLGVIHEYQQTGIAAVLFYETAKRAISLGYSDGEASWVLEDNLMMNRSAELLNAERYKTYRIYRKDF
jgi:GNAT superfamily N-acetyltransferase